ncbi:hypothetical protein BKA65DRAFT_478354 [Rhexocercosporidium sp. MPI-PUGE-AT-0058]|nr:hypothetical protein BKA65DRAFT_478354 [Rhexocercosporidium sp. MPI-PUGE-AT-0058]
MSLSTVSKPYISPKPDFDKFRFKKLPAEVRHIIWGHSAYTPRFLEVVVKNNYSESNDGQENGYSYFINPQEFHRNSPAALRVCRESRYAVLRFFAVLDLGNHRVERQPDIEYVWMDPADPESVMQNRNAQRVLFNPFIDTVVLQAGHVLHKQNAFLDTIPKLRPLPAVGQVDLDELSPSPAIQHLATTMFPWDMTAGLPRSPDKVVQAFPKLETLCVVGQRNEECECGYCIPSGVDNPEEIKEEVTKTIETVVVEKNSKEDKPVYKVPEDVRVVERKRGELQWWEQITDLQWDFRVSLPDVGGLSADDSTSRSNINSDLQGV